MGTKYDGKGPSPLGDESIREIIITHLLLIKVAFVKHRGIELFSECKDKGGFIIPS